VGVLGRIWGLRAAFFVPLVGVRSLLYDNSVALAMTGIGTPVFFLRPYSLIRMIQRQNTTHFVHKAKGGAYFELWQPIVNGQCVTEHRCALKAVRGIGVLARLIVKTRSEL
jgi:hypothetical protein